MAFSLGPARGGVRPEMNVTPLVDVVLVLLIIFMVVTPLLTKKFWLNVPKKADETVQPPSDAPPETLVVYFSADGSIRMNSQLVSMDALLGAAKSALATRGDGVVFFDAEDQADYARALDVMDTLRAAGATTIAIAPEPLKP